MTSSQQMIVNCPSTLVDRRIWLTPSAPAHILCSVWFADPQSLLLTVSSRWSFTVVGSTDLVGRRLLGFMTGSVGFTGVVSLSPSLIFRWEILSDHLYFCIQSLVKNQQRCLIPSFRLFLIGLKFTNLASKVHHLVNYVFWRVLAHSQMQNWHPYVSASSDDLSHSGLSPIEPTYCSVLSAYLAILALSLAWAKLW